jgi:hypothetical protein
MPLKGGSCGNISVLFWPLRCSNNHFWNYLFIIFSSFFQLLGWLVASPIILGSLYMTFLPCFKFLVRRLSSPPSSPKMPLQPRSEFGLKVWDIWQIVATLVLIESDQSFACWLVYLFLSETSYTVMQKQ